MREIVPTAQLGTRMPTQGRIRIGVKSGNSFKSIETFRFTSPDQVAIEMLARIYGGSARPWRDERASPKDQFEVITQAKEIRIFLPKDSLSVWYENWSAGGVQRRCDGVTVEVPSQDEMVSAPCICRAEQSRVCEPHTRLNMILPEIPFGGVWMLQTKGWNATEEMPGMAAMVEQLQDFGVVEAKLRVRKEERMIRGRKKIFVVPHIVHTASPDQMLSGQAAVGALGRVSDAPALSMGQQEREWFEEETGELEVRHVSEETELEDEEIFDAELVDPSSEATEPEPPEKNLPDQNGDPFPPSAAARHANNGTPAFRKLLIEVSEAATRVNTSTEWRISEDDLRHAVAYWASEKRSSSSKDLDPAELSKAIDAVLKATPKALSMLVDGFLGRPM